MSETKLATKADLKEMYDRMLPYLGGMPEMVVNKFSKGDLYSTDEKMIGQWVDGKPLYQKTVNISNLQKLQAVSLGVTADTLVDSWVRLENSSYQFTNAVSYYVSGSDYRLFAINKNKSTNDVYYYIACSSDNLITGFTGHITIQYTKTTDSPISIGSDTDYSTDEKVIGTWIDGRTLFQRTFAIPSTSLVADQIQIITIAENLNIDEIVSFDGMVKSGSNATNFVSFNYNNQYWYRPLFYGQILRLDAVSHVATTLYGYLTIKYVKSTS